MARKATRTAPRQVRLYRAEVRRSVRLTPSWQRVTVQGDELADFSWMGFDHWFRLFFPLPHQQGLSLPELAGSQWWKPYLAMSEEERPYCANYTVADHRREVAELDIDFVLHRSAGGELEGPAAVWACAARPGDPLAVLDQGRIFDRPEDGRSVVMVADETGLPGIAGIMRSLPRDVVGHLIQEVPTALDRRELGGPAGVQVTWVHREDSAAVPGRAALAELERHPTLAPDGYGYVVGESSLATGGRRLLQRLGLPKERITFSGYWKHPDTSPDTDTDTETEG